MRNPEFTLACPIPIEKYPTVQLAHGSGGRLMHQLIEKMFAPAFRSTDEDFIHDGAVFPMAAGKLAFTTDSYVVKPLFFPGGNIGTLAVNGTVNDLAMCGAKPLFLSCGFILEEGLPMGDLWKVVQSMQQSVATAGVRLVTGDTKVVDRGKGDGIFINTAGLGLVQHNLAIGPARVKAGDAIIINGDLGRHGITIMAEREGLDFETTIQSDCAPLNGVVEKLIEAGLEIHCLRDLTRGGLSSALVEIATTSKTRPHIFEKDIPVEEEVRGACEMLGLDPLYVANEGRFVLFLPEAGVANALRILKEDPVGAGAVRIGSVQADSPGLVTMQSSIGATRVVDMLSGDQLPRIC